MLDQLDDLKAGAPGESIDTDEASDRLNQALDELYDWADNNRVWVA